jgi:hypothetical protein
MKRIVIRIDNLALRGFRHADRHAVSAGLQAELARLFAAPGRADRLAALGSVAGLSVRPFRVESGSAPGEIGLAAARAIGGSVRR